MNVDPRPATVKNPAEWFTGDVWMTPIASPQTPGQTMNAGVVRFSPGARTAWHSHPGGQTLYVTDGVARVQARGGYIVEVPAGGVVVCPPDEEHWHGAAPDTFMTHVAMYQNVGDAPPAIWGAHVTDDEYDAD